MLTYDELSNIVHSVHDRFTYVSDMANYNDREHWVAFNDIPSGNFTGDCEDFAQAIRKELSLIGEKTRFVVCGVNSDIMNHAVCEYDGYIIDNIHKWPMARQDLITYKFMSISGYEPGDAWHEIL